MSKSPFASVFSCARSLAIAVAALGMTSASVAQQLAAGLSEQILGTWTVVSLVLKQGDTTREPFGSMPKGRMVLDRAGTFSLTLLRDDLPKVASNNRESPTPEESKAIASGVLTYYGTFTFDEKERVLTFRIEGCSFANWNGTTQKRLVALSGDQLTLTNQTTAVGAGTSYLVWQRTR